MIKLKSIISSIIVNEEFKYPSMDDFSKSNEQDLSSQPAPQPSKHFSQEFTILPKNAKPGQLMYYNNILVKIISVTPDSRNKNDVWVEMENRSGEGENTKIFSLKLNKNTRVFKPFKKS
jgi:hypothetical protein